jgi:hypothetical protein
MFHYLLTPCPVPTGRSLPFTPWKELFLRQSLKEYTIWCSGPLLSLIQIRSRICTSATILTTATSTTGWTRFRYAASSPLFALNLFLTTRQWVLLLISSISQTSNQSVGCAINSILGQSAPHQFSQATTSLDATDLVWGGSRQLQPLWRPSSSHTGFVFMSRTPPSQYTQTNTHQRSP